MKKSLLHVGISAIALCAIVITSSFTSDTRGVISSAASNYIAMPAPNFKELILQFDVVSEKTAPDIRESIEANGGVFFKGYCAEQRAFMYLVNCDVYPNFEFLNKLDLKGYHYTIKEGSTIAQVQTACGMEVTPTNHTNETE